MKRTILIILSILLLSEFGSAQEIQKLTLEDIYENIDEMLGGTLSQEEEK